MMKIARLVFSFAPMRVLLLSAVMAVFLSACSTAPKASGGAKTGTTSGVNAASISTNSPNTISPNIPPKVNAGNGGYYQDDGPGTDIPANLELTLDPIPNIEPYSRTGNKPYQVFGKTYTPITDNQTPFKQRGIASWYGKKFHGKRTSSGEAYDMFKITAAHPILPIPSYARVTNLSNGKQVIVRINDRGPFHSSRVMDLSYTAALKLGYLSKGSSEIEIERLLPDDILKMAENRQNGAPQFAAQAMGADVSASQTVIVRKVILDTQAQAVALDSLLEEKAQIVTTATTMNTTQGKVEVAAPVSSAPIEGKGNFYLQFAAFGLRANAEASMGQMKHSLSRNSQQLEMNFEIVQQGNLYRLQAGPYLDRTQASAVSEKLALNGSKPIIVQR
jgi:rare lipoprotein A